MDTTVPIGIEIVSDSRQTFPPRRNTKALRDHGNSPSPPEPFADSIDPAAATPAFPPSRATPLRLPRNRAKWSCCFSIPPRIRNVFAQDPGQSRREICSRVADANPFMPSCSFLHQVVRFLAVVRKPSGEIIERIKERHRQLFKRTARVFSSGTAHKYNCGLPHLFPPLLIFYFIGHLPLVLRE